MAMGSPIFFLPWSFTQFYLHPQQKLPKQLQHRLRAARKTSWIARDEFTPGSEMSPTRKKNLTFRRNLLSARFSFAPVPFNGLGATSFATFSHTQKDCESEGQPRPVTGTIAPRVAYRRCHVHGHHRRTGARLRSAIPEIFCCFVLSLPTSPVAVILKCQPLAHCQRRTFRDMLHNNPSTSVLQIPVCCTERELF